MVGAQLDSRACLRARSWGGAQPVRHRFGSNRQPNGQRGAVLWFRTGSNVVVPQAFWCCRFRRAPNRALTGQARVASHSRRGSRQRVADVKPGAAVVGIDAGVTDLIVVADPGGNELARHRARVKSRPPVRSCGGLQREAARQVCPGSGRLGTKRQPSRGR